MVDFMAMLGITVLLVNGEFVNGETPDLARSY